MYFSNIAPGFTLLYAFCGNCEHGAITIALWVRVLRRPVLINDIFYVARQLKSGLGRLIAVISRSHTDTPHPVGLLWTSDLCLAEAATYTAHN